MNREALLARMLVVLEIGSLVFLAGCGGGTNQSLNNQPPPPPGANPVPTITTISPNSAMAGGAAFTLMINGTNFIAASVVSFGGTTRTTTFVNSTQLTAAISAAAIASAGTPAVTVSNPASGGGTSNVVNFIISATSGGTTNPITWTSVAVAPDLSGQRGKFVYVANSDLNNVSMFAINTATGALTPVGTMAAGTAPQSVSVDPSAKFVYVANGGSNDISMYTINSASGALQPLGTMPAGTSPISVAVDPSGKFAYVVNEFSNDISMYMINTITGALEPLGPIASGVVPTSVAVDHSGKFVYVTNADPSFPLEFNTNTGNVSVYSIDPTTGVLTPEGTRATGVYPRSVAVDPSGKFVYVANCGDFERNQGDVAMYTISPNGSLTSAGTIGAGSCPLSVAAHPSGKFAYAVNTGSDGGPDIEGVSIYAINPTGTLTSLGIVENTGYCPSSIAIDPSGKFAYVTNHCDNTMSVYTIDPTTGALTLLGTVGT